MLSHEKDSHLVAGRIYYNQIGAERKQDITFEVKIDGRCKTAP